MSLCADLLMPLPRQAVETLQHLGTLAPNSRLSASPFCYEHVGYTDRDGTSEVSAVFSNATPTRPHLPIWCVSDVPLAPVR